MTTTDGKLSIQPWPESRQQSRRFEFDCPGDKSVTHRALMFAAMAKGTSRIESPLRGADCQSTAACFQKLGVSIDWPEPSPGGERAPAITLISPGIAGWRDPAEPLDCGNSGTTARLLLGLLAARPGLQGEMTGDESLSQRPMGRVVDPLRAMGAKIDGANGGATLPLQFKGQRLEATAHHVDKATAQVKSCLLLAGTQVAGKTTVTLPRGSRDHTENLLHGFGAQLDVDHERAGWEEVSLMGPFTAPAGNWVVPGDPSSAAFFAAIAALSQGAQITINGVMQNETRDGFLTILDMMGADMSWFEDDEEPAEGYELDHEEAIPLEPVADLQIKGGAALQPVHLDSSVVPTLIDEIPLLALVAAQAEGRSRLEGLAELRVKESDRLAQTEALLSALGVKVSIDGDALEIEGQPGQAFQACTFDPQGDHRLAMVAAVAGCFADGPVTILGPDCVNVSFPGFFELLAQLTQATKGESS